MRAGLALRVNMAVVTVTTTGRCTSAHNGMLTCGHGSQVGHYQESAQAMFRCHSMVQLPLASCQKVLPNEASSKQQTGMTCNNQVCCMDALTSGVNMERGTRVQKKPRDTQCVANLRMPK